MTNAPSAPSWLAPDYRYTGDDWTGANALTYVVYETAPVYAADGVTITTAGVPRDLTGCTVTGTLRYRAPCGGVEPASPAGLVTATGVIVGVATAGVISLSLSKAQTVFPRQCFPREGILDPRRALLVAQPRVVDAQGNVVTVGLQPIFVF